MVADARPDGAMATQAGNSAYLPLVAGFRYDPSGSMPVRSVRPAAAWRRWRRVVIRRVLEMRFTAMATAFSVPTSTTSFRLRVMAV